ncbi:TonB-dependent receptor [bacterium]|nr:TonB-dependent receptor [bacterium]
MSRRRTWIVLFSIFMLIFISAGFAGTTGKIAGKVTDQSTGDPIPGANVLVAGTGFGAASDIDGNFTILQVPPGVYSVTASVIGYAKVNATQVRVFIDQTAQVDFDLSMEALQGEAVTIVAERGGVKRDVATSVASFSTQEVALMPVVNVDQVVELQAGVEDGLIIRGGDPRETLFQIDGFTMRDPRNNQPITGIAMSAIQEISVERGGFNAEYGQVRAGLINVVTKEGSKSGYHGSISTKASPPTAKYFGVSPFDANSMWNRPYLDDAVCWTGTQNGAWDIYTQRQYPTFEGWNSISQGLLEDSDPGNDLSPEAAQKLYKWEHRRVEVNDQPDYNIDLGIGGPVPVVGGMLGDLRFFGSYQREREMLLIPLTRDDYLTNSGSFQLASDISPSMKLTVTGLMGNSYNVAINDGDEIYLTTEFGPNDARPTVIWTPTTFIRTPEEIAKITAEKRSGRIFNDGWYNNARVSHRSIGAKLTHTLNPETFYEVSLEHVSRKYATGPIGLRSDSLIQEIVPGYWVTEAPNGWSPLSENAIGDPEPFHGGHTGEARDSSEISSTKLKIDLTSQVNFNNLVKAGAELAYHDLKLDWGQVNSFTSKTIFNREHNFPIQGALYVQDKLEARGFILNLGLRLDFSDANTEWVDIGSTPFDKDYLSTRYDPNADYTTIKSEMKWSLSPRLGISHPISENSKLFFNYGHFKQLPTYEELLRISRTVTGGMQNYGDPNLEMEKTVSYELGYDHMLLNSFLIQAAAFYHDITDQQTFTNYTSADGSVIYQTSSNNNYEDIRGFELTLRKQSGRWFTGFANYTYQVNTYGYFGTRNVFENPSEQRQYNELTRNLYQGKPLPRPYARVNLVFRTPPDFGMHILGFNPTNNWTMSMIYNWKAGDWIDWNPSNQMDIYDNIQVRDYHNFTLRINKTIPMKKVTLTLFADVDNLFGTKRLSGAGFYDYFDYEYYMKSLHLPESDDWDNIPGHDRPGDYRKDNVTFQPIEQRYSVENEPNPLDGVIYYEEQWGRYMEYVDNAWVPVDKARMDKVLEDKAYIDMPNQTSFNFLNPRQWFFGVKLSFDLN